ncbi:hypothetical protein PVAP13_9NG208000 [Panicum virgatum]|uniref:Uncharacterized protein n=1 Tax=Panicum virgatum TaxID=38727 RepID=A0A8T0MMV4_PANVG|nr:hypothetical protein PVAP13_9NG208000 [Panicum virgatum]
MNRFFRTPILCASSAEPPPCCRRRTAPRRQRGWRSRMVPAAASQVGAEMGDYLGLVQLIGRLAAARPAPPLRPCIGDSDDYFSRILLVGILTDVPTSVFCGYVSLKQGTHWT